MILFLRLGKIWGVFETVFARGGWGLPELCWGENVGVVVL